MQSQLIFGLLIFVIIWIVVLTFYLLRITKNYSVFTEGVHKKTLEEVLTRMVREQKIAKEDIANIVDRCNNIERRELLHIQKVGLLRFNPFKDTGGDQSFVLSLIDAKDTGVVITALYSRSGTRWYAKKVVEGKGIEHALSEDEKSSLKMAKESK